MAKVYQVGRYQGNKLHPAFNIQQLPGGGVRITNEQQLTSQERTLIYAHFGRMLRATTGVGVEQHRKVFRPGSKEHFEHAVCELPRPFALMRRSK